MMKRPLFSLITVCRNSAAHIREAIESVLQQDCDDYEYIVVDGASGDSTLELLDQYRSSLSQLVVEPDCGPFDAMNKGVRLSRGEYLMFVNSDDRLYDSYVLSRLRAVIARESPDILAGNVLFVGENGARRQIGKPRRSRSRYVHFWPSSHSVGVVYKADLHSAHGEYNWRRYPLSADAAFLKACESSSPAKSILGGAPIGVFRETGITKRPENVPKILLEEYLLRIDQKENALSSYLILGLKLLKNC